MAHTPATAARVSVFYDAGCSLCRREVNHYRRIDTGGAVNWIDITREHEALQRAGLDLDSAMRRMYVMDRNGRLQSGARAFVTLWHALPFYRRLAQLVETLRLLPVMEWAYVRFARWRYARRCRDGMCAVERADG